MGVRELEEGRENLDFHLSLFWRCEHLSWGMKWCEDGRVWREYRGQWDRGTGWCQSPKVPTLHPQYGLKLKEKTVMQSAEDQSDWPSIVREWTEKQKQSKIYYKHYLKKVCGLPHITPTCDCWASNPLIRCYNSLHSSVKALYKSLEPGCRDLLPFSHQSISELRPWCWVIHSGPCPLDWHIFCSEASMASFVCVTSQCWKNTSVLLSWFQHKNSLARFRERSWFGVK